MNRSDPFNQTDGMGDGTININQSGYANKEYNLWNRNPMVVSEKYLSSNGALDRPAKTTLPTY